MSLSKNPFVEFLKATLAGGVLFLLPVVLVLIVLHRAMSYALGAAKPISQLLPVESVIGAYGENALAIFMLILVSLLAGLVARTREGRRVMSWSEHSLLGGLPQYQLVKTMAEGLSHVENAKKSVRPALISIEDGWQIGYLLEPLENGWVTVFLPQAPTPMSGNVMYLPANRARPLDITMIQAMEIVKHIGVGSAKALQGTDLTLPAGT